MKTFLIALVVLSVTAISGFSQKTPSETAVAYMDALKKGDYAAAADLFAPGALGDFRKMLDFGEAMPADAAAQFYPTFFGPGATQESVAEMSDSEFFCGFLGFVMKQAEAAGGLEFGEVDIIGEVPEGDDVVHVLTRSRVSVGELKMEQMEVVSFTNVDGTWMAILSGKMEGMAAQLKAAFTQGG